jgi:hypothetical protein
LFHGTGRYWVSISKLLVDCTVAIEGIFWAVAVQWGSIIFTKIRDGIWRRFDFEALGARSRG